VDSWNFFFLALFNLFFFFFKFYFIFMPFYVLLGRVALAGMLKARLQVLFPKSSLIMLE